MKKLKRLLAFVLALVLALSCIGTALAVHAGPTAAADLRTTKAETGKKDLQGFRSGKFQRENSYRYRDDEIVRAIVILEGDAASDVADNGSKKAADYRLTLAKRHNELRKAMKEFNFEFKYDFTALLNGMSGDIAYGDLDKLADMDGVKAVYIANHYAEPELLPATAGSGVMTGSVITNEMGLTGAGSVIAVLDTGLRVTHEAFQPSDLLDPVLTEADVQKAEHAGAYVNAKVPFAYDYGDMDSDVSDEKQHGTHVAGIAAGYVPTDDGGYTFCGAAPGAQLLAMKIFMDGKEGTYSDIYFAALEDAYLLGADVINMSIGSQNGFTYDSSLETEVYGNIYDKLTAAGILVCVAAGNEGSQADNSGALVPNTVTADYADYGVVGTPSTYSSNISVASVDNLFYPSYVISAGDESFPFTDASAEVTGEGLWMTSFAGKTMDCVKVPGVGAAADFEGLALEGKIALVARGELNFEEKVENAANAGAIGVIVTDNVDEPLNMQMSIETYEIPAIFTTMAAGKALEAAKKVTVPEGQVEIDNETAGCISNFSSWGTSPDLTLRPSITSVGGNVYSTVPAADNSYDVFSGTSMATPNMAGNLAALLQLLRDEGVEDRAARAELAQLLMENTAEILLDENGVPYSPRRQGAGLGNVLNAFGAFYADARITNPLIALGDDAEKKGVYTFDIELVNDNEEAVEYQATGFALRDHVEERGGSDVYGKYNTLTSDYLEAEVSLSCGDTVTVPAGGKVTVTATVTLSENDKALLNAQLENGGFIEGYVLFGDEEGEAGYADGFADYIHATFMGFYGDWTKAPVLEKYDFRDIIEVTRFLDTTVADAASGQTYSQLGFTYLDVMEMNTDVSKAVLFNTDLGMDICYAGDNIFDYVDYREEHIAFSTADSDADFVYGNSIYMLPMQLRNARHLVMTVTDKATGEVYYVDDTEYLPKAAFNTDYGIWQGFGEFLWDGTDLDGEYVPSGTVATITYDAVLPYKDAEQKNVWSFDVTVDSTAPVVTAKFDKEKKTITVTASDEEYLQAIYLQDPTDFTVYDYEAYSSDKKGEEYTVTFDVSGLDVLSLYVSAMDYAGNERDVYVEIADIGAPAKVTYVTPAGEKTVDSEIGANLKLEDCTETYKGHEFSCWVKEEYEKTDGADVEGYFAGERTLITGDTTFYALYAKGEWVANDVVRYYHEPADSISDFSGDRAFVGFPYTNYMQVDDPYFLGTDLESHAAKQTPNTEVSTEELEFDTNEKGVYYTFAKVDEDTYTIADPETGKFLAVDGEDLAWADAAKDAALWTITANYDGDSVLIFNVEQPDLLILFDDVECEFKLYDNNIAVFEYGEDIYYPSDWFFTYLYTRTAANYEVEFFTTSPKAPTHVCPSAQFTDVDTGKWYHEAVDFVVANDLMKGISDTTFEPNSPMTRGMLVTILYRAEGEPDVSGIKHPFTDVADRRYFTKPVAWAYDNDIVKGITETTFEPDTKVSREQLATILFRYANAEAVEEDHLADFPDVEKVHNYAKTALNWAVAEGLITGNKTGNVVNLDPRESATRAQIATILMRYLQNTAE